MFNELVNPVTNPTPVAVDPAAKKSWRRQRRSARFAARKLN